MDGNFAVRPGVKQVPQAPPSVVAAITAEMDDATGHESRHPPQAGRFSLSPRALRVNKPFPLDAGP